MEQCHVLTKLVYHCMVFINRLFLEIARVATCGDSTIGLCSCRGVSVFCVTDAMTDAPQPQRPFHDPLIDF